MDGREFFDKIAEIWDENEVMSTPEKVAQIVEYFDLKDGGSVLDLGTGTGVLLPFIANKIGEKGYITAVDFSSGMLERAIDKFRNLKPTPEFLNLDFENENIPGEYDRIILYCVYPHLIRPIDTLKWLKTVNLKDKGAIFIAFPCGPDFINNIHKERKSESDLLCSASELAKFFQEKGFKASALKDDESFYIVRIDK